MAKVIVYDPATGTSRVVKSADTPVKAENIEAGAGIAESQLADMGKEGAASLLANIRRRGEELAYDTIPAEGMVLGTGNELKIEAAATPAMSIRIQAANCGGAAYGADAVRISTGSGPLTAAIAAADASNPRYDVISLKPDGTLRVTTGTPAGSPTEPSLPANDVKLAVVKVAATDTTIDAGDIFDHRRRAGRTPNEEENTANGSTLAWDITKRIPTGKEVGVAVYRNGLKLKYLATPTTKDHYKVTNGSEKNGATITLGANADNGDKILISYLY